MDTADRGPRLGEDAECLVGGLHGRVGEVRVQLDLIDRRDHRGGIYEPLDVVGAEVGDADRACLARLEHLLRDLIGGDGVLEVGRGRLVQQVHIDVIHAQAAQARVEPDLGLVGAVSQGWCIRGRARPVLQRARR